MGHIEDGGVQHHDLRLHFKNQKIKGNYQIAEFVLFYYLCFVCLHLERKRGLLLLFFFVVVVLKGAPNK